MQKCSPIETRKNLMAAQELAKAGIDFVCIPVEENKLKLLREMEQAFDRLLNIADEVNSHN